MPASSLPTPALSLKGAEAISTYLDKVVKERESPATWLGATTAKGELFLEWKGERVWGDGSKGDVREDTSEFLAIVKAFKEMA